MRIEKKDGFEIVKFDNPAVAIVCFEIDPNGVLINIGVVKEKNTLFEKGYSENLVMGTVESQDTSLLERAMKELKEEAGLEVTDSTKWAYLGEIYTSKISPDPVYLFSVDVSGLTPQVAAGDGNEKIINFSMKPLEEIVSIGESLLLSSFFLLFMKVYGKQLKPVTP